MRFLFKALVLVGVLAGGVWVWGRSMPRDHRASSAVTLVAPADSVFALVADIGRTPGWWRDVQSARRLTGKRRESWEQVMRGSGPVQVEITSMSYGERLVTTILNDEQQDWGGKWTYSIERSAAGTELTIVEDGWVESPFFRVVMKLRGGPHKTLDSYLRSLGAHFGETVTPRHDRAG
jgi:uncharacterized protein YndB with AHSA1/START domain